MKNELGSGTIAAAYVVGAFIPLIGWIMAVYLLVKSKAGHAIGVGAVSIVMFFVWLGVLGAMDRAGSRSQPLSLSDRGLARSTAERSTSLAPQLPGKEGANKGNESRSAADLVGVWRANVFELGNRAIITLRLGADGSSWYRFETVFGTTVDFGTWQYCDGIVFEKWSNGASGRGAIEWIDQDEFVLTILDNGVPAYTGVKRHYHRQ